jgi:hypothetical protein
MLCKNHNVVEEKIQKLAQILIFWQKQYLSVLYLLDTDQKIW